MFSTFELLVALQAGLLLLSLRWYLRRNDEVPLIISVFVPYVSTYRFWSVTHDLAKWTDITNFGFAPVEAEGALQALQLIVLGQSVLTLAYLACQRKRIAVSKPHLPPAFIQWLRPRVFLLALAAIPAVYLARRLTAQQVAAGVSLGFQFSNYVVLLPMMLVGVGCLLILLWRFGGLPQFGQRCMAFALLAGVFHLSFNPSSRFMFLGWLIAGAVIATIGCSPRRRLGVLAAVLAVALALFTVAGALRTPDTDDGIQSAAWERTLAARDANMLDGFVLLRQVYPERFGYSYGLEHLEILMRPIPRSIWPNKPVGGYMNKLGIITVGTGFNLGISPSLFGSFYQEGGVWGLVLISGLYGFLLANLVVWTTRLHPFAGCLLRAMVCAALIPLLRGGDLPGIYAWFGMAFWPCLLLLGLRRRDLVLAQLDGGPAMPHWPRARFRSRRRRGRRSETRPRSFSTMALSPLGLIGKSGAKIRNKLQ